VSRWSTRHWAALTEDLDVGEQLLAAHRVEVRGNVADVAEGERVRTRGSVRRHFTAALDAGFVLPGPIFVLGISNQRVLFWRASPFLARPRGLEHSLPLSDLARVVMMRRVGRPSLGVLLGSGPLLVVRSLWGLGLKDLERAFEQTTS
jgi:hypothetical protein